MKVVHISTSDFTGAGMAALRTHCALLRKGIDSKMLVLSKKSDKDGVYQVRNLKYFILHNYDRICNRFPFLKIIETEQIRATNYSKQIGGFCSTPFSYIDISKHPIIQEADIVHVHWANGFLDYKTFFERVKKPFVVTIHDENFFMGACHHYSVYNPKAQIEKDYYNIKKRALSSIQNLTLIMLSKSFYKKFETHEFLNNARVEIVPNPIDVEIFRPYEKMESREEFDLPKDVILFVFVGNLIDKNKGLHYILEAIDSLKLKNAKVLAIGPGKDKVTHPLLLSVGEIKSENKMAKYLSASDYFVLSSEQESFSQTAIESQACGIPGIMFPVGIAPELIKSFNGVLCNEINSYCLACNINKILKRKFCSEEIRENIIKYYSMDSVADKLISIYRSIG